MEHQPSNEPVTHHSFEEWIQFHGIQLYAVNFPRELEKELYKKLTEQVFDIGSKVKIFVNEEEERIELTCHNNKLKKNEDVYLIDHMWTFKYRDAEPTLRQNDALLDRLLQSIARYSEKQDLPNNPYEKKRPSLQDYLRTLNEDTKVYDLDDYGIANIDLIPFSQAAEEISLYGNKIENPGQITSFLAPLPNLKALWLNNNPVVYNCVNFNTIGEMMPQLEIINSKFTSKAGRWAMLFYAREQGAQELNQIRELDLASKGVLHMKDISVFDEMTSLEVLDLSDHPEFFLSDVEIEEQQKQQKEGAIHDGGEIEFIQKAHTLDELLGKLKWVKKLLCDESLENYILQTRDEKGFLPSLVEINRVAVKILDGTERDKEKNIRKVMDKIWQYLGTYRIVKEDQMDEENVWYLMDEVGTAMRHSDEPNFAVHPFIYSPNMKLDDHTITYSIAWPIKEINDGDVIYRDFLKGIDESKFRSARLAVWFNTPQEYYLEQLKIYRGIKPNEDAMEMHQYYQNKYQAVEPIDKVLEIEDKPITVYTDYIQIQEHLKSSKFQQIEDPFAAQIAWVTVDYYTVLRQKINLNLENKFFNQFQYEGSLVMKNHLATLVKTTLNEDDQNIIQETYILNDYLPAFVGRFLEKKKRGEENSWILKPTNMARSMDTFVTNNLDQIVRMVETGPKIAQKYINNTLTLNGKKFDMRFVVLLKSVLPLEVYIYDEFYTRHSNNQYEMTESSFANYETHFTVMNYKEGVALTNIRYFDFEKEFDAEYAGVMTFDVIKKRIYQAIKKLFIAFQVKHGKDFEGLGEQTRKCRSIYGVDIMVNDQFEPKILEATFSPDCKRACRFNPDFFNEVFGCLFLNETKNVTKI